MQVYSQSEIFSAWIAIVAIVAVGCMLPLLAIAGYVTVGVAVSQYYSHVAVTYWTVFLIAALVAATCLPLLWVVVSYLCGFEVVVKWLWRLPQAMRRAYERDKAFMTGD